MQKNTNTTTRTQSTTQRWEYQNLSTCKPTDGKRNEISKQQNLYLLLANCLISHWQWKLLTTYTQSCLKLLLQEILNWNFLVLVNNQQFGVKLELWPKQSHGGDQGKCGQCLHFNCDHLTEKCFFELWTVNTRLKKTAALQTLLFCFPPRWHVTNTKAGVWSNNVTSQIFFDEKTCTILPRWKLFDLCKENKVFSNGKHGYLGWK